MNAHLNTGLRHVMPAYVFAWPLFAGAATSLLRRRWLWVLVVAAILHATSSLATFGTHIPYANRFWGGPANIHNLLTDSNVDWGQQLHQVRKYLAQRNVKDCWFSYIGQEETKFEYWGIPCKAMPNLDALPPDYPAGAADTLPISSYDVIPEEIDGPVLISADELSGYLTGPGPLNPYGDFQKLQPSANLGAGVLVYDGHFSVPRLAALTLRMKVAAALNADPSRGLEMARRVVTLDPDSVASWIMLGRALQETGQTADARAAFEQAIHVAESVQPDFQSERIPEIRKLLDSLSGSLGSRHND